MGASLLNGRCNTIDSLDWISARKAAAARSKAITALAAESVDSSKGGVFVSRQQDKKSKKATNIKPTALIATGRLGW